MTSETSLIKIGEINAGSDAQFDHFDLKHKEISQILVSGGNNGIMSIQFQYMEKGKYVLSEQYGSNSGSLQFHTIELNHPDDYITGIYGNYNLPSVKIMEITFTSNIQGYGPFGITDKFVQCLQSYRRNFNYNLGKSFQFGGFHGTYNESRLVSLGLYLSPKTVPPSFVSKIPKKDTNKRKHISLS